MSQVDPVAGGEVAIGGPAAPNGKASGGPPVRAGIAERRVGGTGITLIGVLLLAVAAVLVLTLLGIWPAIDRITAQGEKQDQAVWLLGWNLVLSPGVCLLLLVIVSSCFGSYIHVATSFADYVGNRRLVTSWIWWYLLRIFVGISLAVLFYFTIRAGVFSTGTTPSQLNAYGIATLAGLVGLFSKQATDKLREVFDTMFRTAEDSGDAQRRDKIVNARPRVDGIEPLAVDAGAEQAIIRIRGVGFMHESTVQINQTSRVPTYVSPGELTLELTAADLAQPGSLVIAVVNPGPGGGASDPVQVPVRPAAPAAQPPGGGDAQPPGPPPPGGGTAEEPHAAVAPAGLTDQQDP